MVESKELKKIKKLYGEDFMKLCRRLFPTILEHEGRLLEILEHTFSNNSDTLCRDIIKNGKEGEFKNFIFSKFDTKDPKKQIIEERTPYEILEEAGYDLFECTTEEEIQKFEKYYDPREKLCTFRGGRLNNCVVFWAVKKDAEGIKREDFKDPKREDEYGTSVMGIQFSKYGACTVSIKNRYNHTVNNPDATYGNDLDKIAPGLTQSFEKLLAERGLKLENSNKEGFRIPGYIVNNDGKCYKYNVEFNDTYYCPGNIIIENGQVYKLEDPEQEILIDYFVVDLKNKTIKLYDTDIEDSFVDDLHNIGQIRVEKDKERGRKIITIKKEGKNEPPIIIEIDNDNQIVKYENNKLKELKDDFLYINTMLTELNLPNVINIGNYCLFHNKELKKLNLPSVINIGDFFLPTNRKMTKADCPKLESVGEFFAASASELKSANFPVLENIGSQFLATNRGLADMDYQGIIERVKCYRNGCIENCDTSYVLEHLKRLSKMHEELNHKISSNDITKLDNKTNLTTSEVGIGRAIIDKDKEGAMVKNK